MPSITIAELISELKLRGFEGFSNTELTRYIDWAWREVLRKTNWEFEHKQANVVVTPPTYRIYWRDIGQPNPDQFFKDLIRLEEITEGAKKELEPINTNDFFDRWASQDLDNTENRGDPTEYYNHFENFIYLLPPPDTERTYRVYYWEYVGTAGAALDRLMLDGWDEILLCGAEARGHYRARQPEFGRLAEDKFNQLIIERYVQQEMRNENLPERVDSPWSRVR